MLGHHFICYSPAEAKDFAIKLCDILAAGPPAFPVWLDKRNLRPGEDWDDQIVEAIRACASLLFVMTKDSVEPHSVCKQEWTRALRYKKPVIPLRLDQDAEMPFRLGSRQHIDFTGTFETGLAQLRNHLQWLASPAGALQGMKDRLADAQRDLRRASDEIQQARVESDLAQLKQEIAHQQKIVDDPEGAAQRVQQSIERGLERERQPAKPVGGVSHTKFINPPPGVAPSHFQDRDDETRLLGTFLEDDAKRLITVVGRAGMGKTAVVCRLLKALERGTLPDGETPLPVDGIVYLSEAGSYRVNVANLFASLCRLLPDDVVRELDAVYKNPQASAKQKMQALLAAFPRGRVVVLMDNFEDLVDSVTFDVLDDELDEALRTLLHLPHHAVKVILTTRVRPRSLNLFQPGRQAPLYLDEGLPSPYAENILRAMDADGKVGLKTAPDALLDKARERTNGNPRALEALFAILAADRDTTLPEILSATQALLPETVTEVLVGEAFSRLDAAAQRIMQALAVYGHPVSPVAVDYLLQPHLPGVDGAPLLSRLVNRQLARKEKGLYYLHPVDRAYALSRIPKSDELDRFAEEESPFTQFALFHRGANYFKQARKPREEWKSIDDLAPQLAEFDLRCAGQDYDTAARVLLDIDFGYLFFRGHFRLMAQLHERLSDRLNDPFLKQYSIGNLGTAYWSMGQIEQSIRCYEQALAISREIGHRKSESAWLGNLGNCYATLGQTTKAIDYHQQTLAISREIGHRKGECSDLGNLGLCYANLGQTTKAIDYYQQTLAISREIGHREIEGIALSNLVLCHANLGQTTEAIDYLQQALAIARETGYRYLESLTLANYGDVLVDQEEWSQAVQHYREAIDIADEIGNAQTQLEARLGLARAHLFSSDVAAGRAVAQAASTYDIPLRNHDVQALLGVIALRQRNLAEAHTAFETAVAQADELLHLNAQIVGALDTKGLALCGLALCGKANPVAPAVEAYRAARAINSDAGVVGRVLRLFDALAQADEAGVLADVRAAAGVVF